jgi:hypothetical protein
MPSPPIRVEKRNISRHPSDNPVGAPTRGPHLLHLAIDKFMTGGSFATFLFSPPQQFSRQDGAW